MLIMDVRKIRPIRLICLACKEPIEASKEPVFGLPVLGGFFYLHQKCAQVIVNLLETNMIELNMLRNEQARQQRRMAKPLAEILKPKPPIIKSEVSKDEKQEK